MDLGLGKLITTEQARDAIHIAIAPVTVTERLAPGTHVGLVEGGVGRSANNIGIIDPFLPHYVEKGQRCWLFLYPNTVTSLRHEWTHPAFTTNDNDKSMAEIWLRAYAMKMNCYDEPGKAFSDLIDGLRAGELFAHGTDLHGLWELDDADDLRHYAEQYLGIRINWDDFEFSCSC